MKYNSIWQDVYYETSGNSIQFSISENGNVIYNGKAYARPNTNQIKVNITNICENYLNSSLPDLTGFSGTVSTNIYKQFVLSTYNEVTDIWATAETYNYLMNYDREYEPDYNTGSSLNVPINYHAVSGMITPSSNYMTTTINATNADYDFSYCGEYSLIYLNARGGWDSFLMEGICRRTDDYTVSQYTSTYDNNTTQFSSNRYMNIIKPRFELNTGFLTEQQSSLFVKHLVSSNKVYLQNLVSGDIMPVIIVDKSAEYKRYNNGNNISPIYYTLTVEASQEYKRK